MIELALLILKIYLLLMLVIVVVVPIFGSCFFIRRAVKNTFFKQKEIYFSDDELRLTEKPWSI